MNDRVPEADAAFRVAEVFARQRGAFEAQPFPSAGARRASLCALKRSLLRHQDAIAGAIHQDFGWRSPFRRQPGRHFGQRARVQELPRIAQALF